MNVIEFIRFMAMYIICGAFFRLVELLWGGEPGLRGDLAEGIGVVH